MIITIFGKKGSGKSILSKQFMLETGGRVVFLSPVESISLRHIETWEFDKIPDIMTGLRPGEILVVRRADTIALDLIACQALIDGNGFTIVIDEMDRYSDSNEFKDLIHYSRHFNVNIIANTRRYTDVPRLLTSQSDLLCVFATNEPRDLEYLRQFTSREFAESTKTLPQYYYLEYPSHEIKTAHKII